MKKYIKIILLIILIVFGIFIALQYEEINNGGIGIFSKSNVSSDIETYDLNYFTLMTKDQDDENIPISNATFILTSLVVQGSTEIESTPLDEEGNPVGEETIIDGVTYRTISTNENGQVELNLADGTYKLQQISTSSGYSFDEDAVYYFAIGTTRGEIVELVMEDPLYMNNTTTQSENRYSYYKATGRSDSTTLYYYEGKLSFVDANNVIKWTKDTNQIYQILSQDDENGDGYDDENWWVLYDSSLVEMDNDGNTVQTISLTSGMRDVTIDNNGNFVIAGEFSGTKTISASLTSSNSQIRLSNSGNTDIFVMTLDSNYKISNINNIGGSSSDSVKSIVVGDDGSYYITAFINSNRISTEDGNESISYPICVINISEDDLEATNIFQINAYAESYLVNKILKDGGEDLYYAGTIDGSITFSGDQTESGEPITLRTDGDDGLLIRFTPDLKIKWAILVGGEGEDHFYDAKITEDAGIVLGGDSGSGGIYASPDETVSGLEITSSPASDKVGTWRGIAVKITSKGLMDWAQEFGYTSEEGCYAVAVFTDDTFALCGFEGGGNESVFLRVSENITREEIEEYTEYTVKNERKIYNITTSAGDGGTISGEDMDVYEAVKYTEDAQKDVVVKADDNYSIKSINITTTYDDGTSDVENIDINEAITEYTVNAIENVQGNIHIEAEFYPAKSYTVNYYEKETTTSIAPSKQGSALVFSEVTEQAIEVEGYNQVEPTTQTITIEVDETQNIINFYYERINATVDSNISKIATDKITVENQAITYNLTYTAEIENYMGNATITIVDTLPYSIDENNSNISGGLYDKLKNTITWTETVEDINTYQNPDTGNISITKQFSVVYDNIDYSNTNIENKANASVYLNTTEQDISSKEVTATTATEFTKDVTITKTWDHTNNIYTIPSSVELQVKNGDEVVARQQVTSLNAVDGNPNLWSYTFTGLDKYDENGKEIVYTAGEAEVSGESLEYYKSSIDVTNITNTYNGPIISQSKSFTTENGQNYVVEGEKITYTVTVKNDGGVGKDVIVSDTITEGTTFVSNSIKVDDEETGYSAEELNSGITVNVDANSETKVTFEVTVDDLPEGTYLKELRNTAVVDGNNTNETTTVVNKSNLIFEKSSNPASGSQVKAGDEITYTITLNNSGTIEAEAVVKDSIPNGTTFVEDSIKINGGDTVYTLNNLTETGVRVPVGASETVTLSFKVRVGDLDDGATIKNVATVNDTQTNEIRHEYIEAEITSAKLQYTENSLDYVVPGEKIVYTIIVRNSGGLDKDVIIKDTVPDETTFVDGSIKVNSLSTYNEQDLTNLTAEDLTNGITLNVPSGTTVGEGFVRLSYEVKVNFDITGEIKNVATVDDEPTNEVTIPILTTEKLSSVIRHDETSTLAENEVTVNDQIKYTVRVTNTGTTTINNVEVKDIVPTGTRLVNIENEGVQEDDEITWNIDSITGGETTEVSFTVKVEYAKDNFIITNVATVDGKYTNNVENPYVKPDPKVESTISKNGTDVITSKDQTVNYEIKFTAKLDDFKGKAKITIVDTLPYEIDISRSKLANGQYNPDEKTITWEEEIDVDTFASDEIKDIVITKSIEIVYVFDDINSITGSMINTVNSTIDLIEAEEEEPVYTEETGENGKETLIEIPTEVIVHHYIYDAETGEYTTIRLAPDETINGIIGKDYTTGKSSQVPSNYNCINEQPDKYTGKMTEQTIEVTYYYSLITPVVTNTMNKTATSKVLTTEGGEVTYNIRYTANIDNYIGKATVVIVDTLPVQIDVDKSDIGDGIYNPTYRTITWEETIDDIDTFTNETYNYNFTRTISVVYTGQNMAEDLTNTVVGTVNVYYPENHSSNPGKIQLTETAQNTATVSQDYKVDVKVEKVWDDNDNLKGHRPDGIIVTIAGGDIENIQIELNDSNNWSYEEKDLDKYDDHGNLINYSVAESEKNSGDLKYYTARLTELSTNDPTKEAFRLTNTYKLTTADLDAGITKTGTEEITSSTEPVNYEINFTSTVKEYIGDGEVVITDTLPYRIDTSKSNLNGGTYDDEAKTITWKENLTNIDTFEKEDYNINITKNISVVFTDLDATQSILTNTVLGKVRLYETEQEDQATDTVNTLININGDVIVKYVDLDTGEEISDSIKLSGKVGDKYTTSRKQIGIYDYVRSTPNTEGLITEETQEVTYYYQRKAAQVIVKYQDTDGNELTDDVIIDGQVEDLYTTEQKEFYGYSFVSVTGNVIGTMTEDTITVIYVYEKIPAKVIVQYLEKDTNQVLALEEEITGYVGDKYSTDRKAIKNYQSAEPEPDNKSGTMTEEPITVIYYYERIPSGDIIVKYVDIDTDEEILYKDTDTGEDKTYGYTISGFVGDNYIAEQKDIPYYNFIRSTSNTTGQLTETGDTVIYYYQKQKFNLGITKSISEITLDGTNKGVGDGKTTKVEIHRKKKDTADLEVKYKIVVSNTEEIAGTAKVVDAIPSGYTVSSNNPTYWTNTNGNLETQVDLQPGESKELEVVLKWVNEETNFGTSENIARITDISNPANYAETTMEDNEDSVTLVVSVETGINRDVYLIITSYLLMIGLVILLYLYEQYQKERKGEIASRKTLKLKIHNDKK